MDQSFSSFTSFSTVHTPDPEDVQNLNDLLNALGIPLTLQSPTDLTPLLLIAIVESMLQRRLDPSTKNATSLPEKVMAIKIFLGVLCDDLLGGVDAEISDINPRNLAQGSWDEVVRIGRVLVTVARGLGLFDYTSNTLENQSWPLYQELAASECEVPRQELSFEGSQLDLDILQGGINQTSLEHDSLLFTPATSTSLRRPDYSNEPQPTTSSQTDGPLQNFPSPNTPLSRTVPPIAQDASKLSDGQFSRRTNSSMEHHSSTRSLTYPRRMVLPESIIHSVADIRTQEVLPSRMTSDSPTREETSDDGSEDSPYSPSHPILASTLPQRYSAHTKKSNPSPSNAREGPSAHSISCSRTGSRPKTPVSGQASRWTRTPSPLPLAVDDLFSPTDLVVKPSTSLFAIQNRDDPVNFSSSQISIRHSGWLGRVEGDIEAFELDRERRKQLEQNGDWRSQSDLFSLSQNQLQGENGISQNSLRHENLGTVQRDRYPGPPSFNSRGTYKPMQAGLGRDFGRLPKRAGVEFTPSFASTDPSPSFGSPSLPRHSRQPTSRSKGTPTRFPPVTGNTNPHATRLTSPTQHALALLHERAKMLEELARIESLRSG